MPRPVAQTQNVILMLHYHLCTTCGWMVVGGADSHVYVSVQHVVQAREPDRAQQAYDNITADGLYANDVATCMLIAGYLKGPRKRSAVLMDRALKLWDNMKLRAQRRKKHLDVGVRQTGLWLCCRAGRMTEASAIFVQLPVPHAHIYNMLIRGYGHVGDVRSAVAVLEQMTLRGIAADADTYNSLVASMCAAGDGDQARKVIDMAAAAHATVGEWAWSALLKVCCCSQTTFCVQQQCGAASCCSKHQSA